MGNHSYIGTMCCALMVQCEQTHSTYAVPRDIWYTINYVESRNPSHFSSIGITNDTGGSNEQCDLAISECSQVRLKKHNLVVFVEPRMVRKMSGGRSMFGARRPTSEGRGI